MKIGGTLMICLLCFIGVMQITELTINQSRSLPYKAFLVLKQYPVKRGDFVSIQGHQPAYLPKTLGYIKRVQGLPGDTIEIKEGCYYINGQYQGKLRLKTYAGYPLTPLQVSLIPQGYVFVAGSARDSYDSRYQEFDLVKQVHLQGKAIGFFKED